MSKTVFLSYAEGLPYVKAMDSLCQSARMVGFDEVIALQKKDIEKSIFWNENLQILKQERGAGYWLWKAYIIKKTLQNLKNDDVLVYCDAGCPSYYPYNLTKFPTNLIELTKKSEQGFLLGAAVYQHGCLKKWTKRDCLILMDSDNDEILDLPQIQSGLSFWTPTQEAFDFLNSWLTYSSDARCLTDINNTLGLPNYSEFLAHRHDQAILTLLAYKKNANYLNFSKGLLFKILKLRPQSSISHEFLRRIDDCEDMASNKNVFLTLIKFFVRLKLYKSKL
jgi:hypothetical protein